MRVAALWFGAVLCVAWVAWLASLGCQPRKVMVPVATEPTWGWTAPFDEEAGDTTEFWLWPSDSIGIWRGGKLMVVYWERGCHESPDNTWDSCKVYVPGMKARIVEEP